MIIHDEQFVSYIYIRNIFILLNKYMNFYKYLKYNIKNLNKKCKIRI